MASNIRVLVSNLGDGNWGTGALEHNSVDTNTLAARSIYFPPKIDPTTGNIFKYSVPSPGDDAAGPAAQSLHGYDFTGWASKTNWIVQVVFKVVGTPPSAADVVAFRVEAIRPTGVAETVLDITGSAANNDLNGAADGISFTYGGHENEAITGPGSYFKFTVNPDNATYPASGTSAYLGTFDIECFVIGWNEGDITYGLGTGS